MRSVRLTSVALAVLVMIAGCGLRPGASPRDSGTGSLDGSWRLTAGTHQGRAISIPAGSQITLKIDGSKVNGSAACNLYRGSIEVNRASTKVNGLSMTEMGCDEPRMAAEAAYIAALAAVATSARTSGSLTLAGPSVKLQFALVPPAPDAALVGTTWTLNSLIRGQSASSTLGTATLVLGADGTLAGSTGCRTFTARYEIVGDQVHVTDLVNDDRACTGGLAGQDSAVLGTIDGTFTYDIAGDSLSLRSGSNGLDYHAEAPTAS